MVVLEFWLGEWPRKYVVYMCLYACLSEDLSGFFLFLFCIN